MTALRAADGFLVLARRFTDSVPDGNLDKARDVAFSDLGGMIASATNLALAVELYVKALYLLASMRRVFPTQRW